MEALVLGATGGIGGEVARLLVARGWKALTARKSRATAWIVVGDAMNRDDVVRAAQGVQLIVHAVNPPGYRNWGQLVLPMIDNTIAAARASGARILLPGTVYNYGPDQLPHIHEDAPQRPVTRKGAIRVEMERRLKDSGLAVLVVRAGDFFGPKAGNNWFAQGLVKPGKPVTAISNPSAPGVGHQWAYCRMSPKRWCGWWSAPTRCRSSRAIRWLATGMPTARRCPQRLHAAGNPRVKVSAFPWWLTWLAAPFVPVFRNCARCATVAPAGAHVECTPAVGAGQRAAYAAGRRSAAHLAG
jgi:hypothetical protein